MTDTERIMGKIDEWVKCHGNGRYADPMKPDVVTPIQQVRAEVEELVEVLLSSRRLGNVSGKIPFMSEGSSCLDIGLGEFGGTRILWDMLFHLVVTVEKDIVAIQRFVDAYHPKKTIVFGSSRDRSVRVQCRDAGPYDFLHIDGDHTYEGVGQDYEDYSPMVRVGGLIAIHDLLLPDVNRFVCELEHQGHEFRRILHSTHVGYACEVKR